MMHCYPLRLNLSCRVFSSSSILWEGATHFIKEAGGMLCYLPSWVMMCNINHHGLLLCYRRPKKNLVYKPENTFQLDWSQQQQNLFTEGGGGFCLNAQRFLSLILGCQWNFWHLNTECCQKSPQSSCMPNNHHQHGGLFNVSTISKKKGNQVLKSQRAKQVGTPKKVRELRLIPPARLLLPIDSSATCWFSSAM